MSGAVTPINRAHELTR